MENCIVSNENIERYVLNQATEEEEDAFQAHLLKCESCRSRLAQYRKLAHAFSPGQLAKEEQELKEEQKLAEVARVIPLGERARPLMIAASIAALVAFGWLSAWMMFQKGGGQPGIAVTTQTDDPPEYAGDGTGKPGGKTFTMVSPATGKYLFVLDRQAGKNEMVFEWTPESSDALLRIKAGNTVLDNIIVKDASQIKVDFTKYSQYSSITWFLMVAESDHVKTGVIQLEPPTY